MLPRELPISEEAVEAATRELRSGIFGPELVSSYGQAVRRSIVVFLQAEGFEVEKRGSYFPSKRIGIMEHRDTQQRLVSDWKPINPEQDTKSAPTSDRGGE